MEKETIDEICLRLKAPIIALERIVNEENLPKIFAEAALQELNTIQDLIDGRQDKGSSA